MLAIDFTFSESMDLNVLSMIPGPYPCDGSRPLRKRSKGSEVSSYDTPHHRSPRSLASLIPWSRCRSARCRRPSRSGTWLRRRLARRSEAMPSGADGGPCRLCARGYPGERPDGTTASAGRDAVSAGTAVGTGGTGGYFAVVPKLGNWSRGGSSCSGMGNRWEREASDRIGALQGPGGRAQAFTARSARQAPPQSVRGAGARRSQHCATSCSRSKRAAGRW